MKVHKNMWWKKKTPLSSLRLDLPSCLFLKSFVTFCYTAGWVFEKSKVSRPFQQLVKRWAQTPFMEFE